MKPAVSRVLQGGALCALCLIAPFAAAKPTIQITPPSGARFVSGQRFDLRVEGKGSGPFSATLKIDGLAVPFSSGVQNSLETDGISSPGYGGFNRRGYINIEPGTHKITATFKDATGTSSATSLFEVVDIGGTGQVKNVIIMLGDGMGIAHRTAARLVRYGSTAGQPNGFLSMDKFPGTGFVTTASLNSIVTDSAPGMAGYVSGAHTQNGQEGVYPANMTNAFYYPRVEYLSEFMARQRGASLGLVSTADVEDATPAANAVHTGNRGAGQGIVDQYLDESARTGLRVLMGGGRRWFLPSSEFGSSRSGSNDYANLPADIQAAWGVGPGSVDATRNLIGDFQAAGFSYVETATELNGVGTPGKLLGLFGYGNMNVAFDKIAHRRDPGSEAAQIVEDYHAPDQPMLDEMTNTAIKVLSKNKNGFVLMVEGAHIDKQAHFMDADRSIGEVIEFDKAVAVAQKFAQTKGDTIVLVLADHECSGFSLIGALTGGIAHLQGLASDTGVTDPATQPERQKVVGVYDAAGFPQYTIEPDGYPQTFDIDNKILVGYGAGGDRYEGWLGKPHPVIDSLLSTNIKTELMGAGYVAQPYQREESAFGFFLRGQAIGRDQAVHTATDIPVSAYSKNDAWREFVGVQTNTDIFFKISQLVFGPGLF
jgi:alkaline phosphatase